MVPSWMRLAGFALRTASVALLLMACLGAFVYGAALWRGGAKTGNMGRAEDGRQYVVLAVGGHWSGLSPASDHLMAFALKTR